MKYVTPFLLYFQKFPVFTARDARLFLRKNGANRGYYRIFMYNLIKGGKAFGIKRGYYTLHDDPMIAGFVFLPFYYGLETALTYHKLWDYMTPITIITVRVARNGTRELMGRNVNVRRVQRKNLFGYSMVQYKEGIYIPMADIEKTLIDSVYFKAVFNKEVYRAMAGKIDEKKLERYLKRYSSIVRAQVYNLIGKEHRRGGR